MKRTTLIILSLLMLLSLAACGNAESEYKYDNIPELLINETVLSTFTYRPVKGGSLSIMQPQDYLGEDIPSEEWGHEQISVLFDEESKVLTSLCYDYTCLHDSPECFAKAMSMVYGSYWNIVDDMIVVVDMFAEQIVGELVPDYLYAFYFSFDGTLIEKISFDLKTLVKQDGSLPKYLEVSPSVAAYDNKVYFDISDPSDQSGDNKVQNRWVVCYNLETKEFSPVANYALPYASWEGNFVNFTEFTEKEIGIQYDNRYAYVINTENNTYTGTDCAEVFDRLVAKGIVEPGAMIETIYPISNVILISNYPDRNYYDMKFEEKLKTKDVEQFELPVNGGFYYEGEMMYSDVSPDWNKYNAYRTLEDDDIILVDRYFENGNYHIENIIIESEKGFIFQYYNAGEGFADQEYTANINGRNILYRKAARLVYVTKDDYFDGQIDEPWYYDAETGMFVQK